MLKILSLSRVPHNPPNIKTKRYITKSVCYHAARMANEIDATAICTLTNSGYTAFQISAWRPESHILAFTSNRNILTQLSLLWGVKAFFYDRFESTDVTIKDVNDMAYQQKYVEKGDYLINLAAMPIEDKGMVNTLRVSEISKIGQFNLNIKSSSVVKILLIFLSWDLIKFKLK